MEYAQILPAERSSAPLPLPGTIPPAPAVMALLSRFNRDELGHAIEVMVALLDIWDGDPDIELNGDESDGCGAEDEPLISDGWRPGISGPGCPYSDTDLAIDDGPCDDLDDDREPEEGICGVYGIDQSTGPQPILQPDRALMRPHIERVRQTKCERLAQRDAAGRSHRIDY